MSELGLYGLGIMGKALARNICSHGFSLSVYDIEPMVTKTFITQFPAIQGHQVLLDFVKNLQKPRKIILMVTAGVVVDQVLDQLTPLLETGDVVVDCGNSFYRDSERRMKELQQLGIYFLSCGISGGEEGALYGPSIMPSGDLAAYRIVEPILMAISAKNEDDSNCCTYIGSKGAGHFVKMLHNGLEYADMQLIAEIYRILYELYPDDPERIATIFEQLQQGYLKSYLLEITIHILRYQNEDGYLLDRILDVAKQKGTGKWTSQISLDYGVAIPSIYEAVGARFLSDSKEHRCLASTLYSEEKESSAEVLISNLEQAMIGAKLSIYAQGFSLLEKVNQEQSYGIDFAKLAEIWQNGCIIKALFLKEIITVYQKQPTLTNLLLSKQVVPIVKKTQLGYETILHYALHHQLYTPVLSSAKNYLNGFCAKQLPTNLIQAQRDYFGAHSYQRVDRSGNFHTEWEGKR